MLAKCGPYKMSKKSLKGEEELAFCLILTCGLKKAYSNLAFFMCSWMMSCVSDEMGFSHLHCIKEWVFAWGDGVVKGMPSADWGINDLIG